MKSYIGTKQINAKPMTRQEYNDFRGWELPDDENGNDEGYLVEYLNGGQANTEEYEGYVSWSPKNVFELAYSNTKAGMTFGHAIELAKQGLKIARKGWNGKGMFAYYVPANSYPASRNLSDSMEGIYEGDLVPYRHYLALKTAQNDIATWSPSTSDSLAEDWMVVE